MGQAKFIAIDIGAESGRAMLASFNGERITLQEAHRFPNVPLRAPGSLHWDVLSLFGDIKQGLSNIAREHRGEVAGIGLDTWGVDYALLDARNELLGLPFHYRDTRTQGMMARVLERVPRTEIFEQTGVQFMEINTLYQLYAMRLQEPARLAQARTLLMMPDLFNFWLTGQQGCEFTNATTTQCYDPRKRAWAFALLDALGLPTGIFPPIIEPGTRLGQLLPAVAGETGLNAQVVAPATHDTCSAVAAVPLSGAQSAWLSSGTWSVLGAEVSMPVINGQSLAFNFTNEGGVYNTFRLSKNVVGLWLIQECRRVWQAAGSDYSYAELTDMAARAPAFRSLIDPDDDSFLRPGDMPARITEFCERTNQPAPSDPGMFVRAALESLACKYQYQLERLETLCDKTFDTLHVVGGGTYNQLLCQFTANATGKRVVAGPGEATTLGNVVMQMLALGHIDSLAQGRALVRQSFALQEYEPHDRAAWQDAYGRFKEMLA